ncbi:hypothetical protein [Streptosporangium roseum]|uniref:Uncharacterized protein n=1 Tax=Streptosporangium roseum (strain ATCC 12428 / DSM 43021 / JCM 3005 / KCTC 9067 / NCIMB 10171 / NRRL 2505 / NI 9100) TaxID=479432 RepID=D2B3K2_STRRD|nr:hypothetical protein [Streptosporangium roseum]ACZ87518.1 hypothetical protein Sros_4664 [Streptosporangium roseum DSM 43021]
MKHPPLHIDELVEHWTILGEELAENVAHAERRPERVREELLKHPREERIEPPTPGRISRIVTSGLHNAEVAWSVRIASRLSPETTQRICALVGLDDESRVEAEVTSNGQAPTGQASAEDDDDGTSHYADSSTATSQHDRKATVINWH